MLGFELIRIMHDAIASMRVADGFERHTQIVGFFSQAWPSGRPGKIWGESDPGCSTLHHFTIEISLKHMSRFSTISCETA